MVLYPNLHTKIRNITKTLLWKAGQGFLVKIDYISQVEHICKKMALAFFEIRPTTHLVCTLNCPATILSIWYLQQLYLYGLMHEALTNR